MAVEKPMEDKKMFDKLIVTAPEGADFKNRRRYFIGSSLAVGVLFLTAVVISIFASDYRLGTSNFELVELIAPLNVESPEPEVVRSPIRSSAEPSLSANRTTIRKVLMSRVDQPTRVPDSTSVVRNTSLAVPYSGATVGKRDSGPGSENGSGRYLGPVGGSETGLTTATPTTVAAAKPIPPPPPVIKKVIAPAGPAVIKSLGVINGKATDLPKPVYSAAAQAVKAQGKVDVQVTIDESGRVISAKAISGSQILRASAEAAARKARFTPTYLSKVPVKVTGVIIYNFTRG